MIEFTRRKMLGMSLGGFTVYALISHTCCEDGRSVGFRTLLVSHMTVLRRGFSARDHLSSDRLA